MEFVEGGNLREILQIRHTLGVPETLRVLEDATSGLAYAYARGITHRDVKLTNLLISSQGEAKLVDFGLAQMFASLGREDEQVDRTVDYAGLEKATGVKTGDVRSDIYFLGCVGHEALTGRPPLKPTRDRHARMRRQRFEEVQPLRPGEINAPPPVYQLIETMMALHPARRYQTPSQALDAIKAARREVSGDGQGQGKGRGANRAIFIAERDERLQEALRTKFKERGYRVFLAGDPSRALDRFQQQPYDALIVDGGTTGDDGVLIYERLLAEAGGKGVPFAAVLILNEEQADLTRRIIPQPNGKVLVRPVTLEQLQRTLEALFAARGP
jgi:CheY-like chemotaxis protein